MKCIKCKDWEDNIKKVDAPLLMANARNPGSCNYEGKSFIYCPWCGTALVEDKFSN